VGGCFFLVWDVGITEDDLELVFGAQDGFGEAHGFHDHFDLVAAADVIGQVERTLLHFEPDCVGGPAVVVEFNGTGEGAGAVGGVAGVGRV
jgi:hypothetical protein